MFVERLKTNFGVNEPIFTNEILKTFDEYSRAYVFRLIDEAKNDNSLVNFDTGVYFLPMKTTFGNSTILAEDVVYKKYMFIKMKYMVCIVACFYKICLMLQLKCQIRLKL